MGGGGTRQRDEWKDAVSAASFGVCRGGPRACGGQSRELRCAILLKGILLEQLSLLFHTNASSIAEPAPGAVVCESDSNSRQ